MNSFMDFVIRSQMLIYGYNYLFMLGDNELKYEMYLVQIIMELIY